MPKRCQQRWRNRWLAQVGSQLQTLSTLFTEECLQCPLDGIWQSASDSVHFIHGRMSPVPTGWDLAVSFRTCPLYSRKNVCSAHWMVFRQSGIQWRRQISLCLLTVGPALYLWVNCWANPACVYVEVKPGNKCMLPATVKLPHYML